MWDILFCKDVLLDRTENKPCALDFVFFLFANVLN